MRWRRKKQTNCRLYSVPFMGDLFHYLPRKVIEVPSSVPHSTFSVLRRRRNICSITTCSIAQVQLRVGAVGEGWGVRSEDDFLGSCSWVIAYQFILLSRTGSGNFALMVSHVTISETERHYSHTWRMLKKLWVVSLRMFSWRHYTVQGFPRVHAGAKSGKSHALWSIST